MELYHPKMVALVLIESYSVMLCHMLKFYLAQLAALLSFKCKATNVAEVMFMRSAYSSYDPKQLSFSFCTQVKNVRLNFFDDPSKFRLPTREKDGIVSAARYWD